MTEAENRPPSFEIPTPPERRFSRASFEYAGAVVFALAPPDPLSDDDLEARLLRVLEQGPYRFGDWLDLPMPVYLVHDDETGDTFRVAVRDGRIEFHVLPGTESAGLRALYDRLVAETGGGAGWSVQRRVEPPD